MVERYNPLDIEDFRKMCSVLGGVFHRGDDPTSTECNIKYPTAMAISYNDRDLVLSVEKYPFETNKVKIDGVKLHLRGEGNSSTFFNPSKNEVETLIINPSKIIIKVFPEDRVLHIFYRGK